MRRKELCDPRPRLPLRAAGHLLRRAPRARHRRDPGLHPAGGDLLLSGLRRRPGAAAGRRQLLDGRSGALLAGQHGKGRGADREALHARGHRRRSRQSPAGADARDPQKLPLASLDLSAVGAGKTKALFDRPEWKQLSESCLGCGTCTFVCPTCQCYDIKEFDSGKLVRRFRCWDSCMYSDFTKMSAGQPRPTQLERFRQRFMHKLVYFPDNNDGIFGCVGCGRCLAKCPIHMNIVKVVKTLGEETT
ncbi:MAG: 4Fe-4S dicluster domain-containing protein [Oscillospiraceae bacterium]